MRRARVVAAAAAMGMVVASGLLGALPAQATSPDATALSASITPNPAVIGSQANVTGTLTDTTTGQGISGSTVQIWRQPPGASGWAHVGNARTDSSGHYNGKVGIPETVNVQVRYNGTAWRQAYSPVTLVQGSAALDQGSGGIASVAFSATAYHLTGSGTAHAGAAGRVATLQVNSGSGWVTAAQVPVGSDLRFSATVLETPLVTYQARWLLGGGPDVVPAASSVGQVTVPAVSNAATEFTIAVYPDSQLETLYPGDTRYISRANYLVANKTRTNLKFMFSVGDNVEFDNTSTTDNVLNGKSHPAHWQYGTVSNGVKPLESAGIPYSLAIGNHDSEATGGPSTGQDHKWGKCRVYPAGTNKCSHTYINQRDTTTFNSYFNVARFGAVPSGGQFQAGKVDNVYSEFTAGGKTWMVLSLELWPRASVVSWANSVVAAHPQDNVIVTTHSFFDPTCHVADSSTVKAKGYQYGDTSPRYLWNNLISKYSNIKMIVSGHVGNGCSIVLTGHNGNKILGLLNCFHSTTTNPIRFLTFDTAADSVNTYVYGPGPKPTSYPQTQSFATMKWVG